MAEVWDLEDKENQDKIPVCARLHKVPEPYFQRVYHNKVYEVLRVLTPDEVAGRTGEHAGRKAGEGSTGDGKGNGKKAKKKESKKDKKWNAL